MKARLVHCAQETCLRISGHRPTPGVSVRIAGREVAVEGARRWRVTVPLSIARTWATSSAHSVIVSLVDPKLGVETSETVLLPPGALGGHLELASLVVRVY